MALSGASSATTSTDASGNYTFSGLANGSYSITPSSTGFTFSPTSSPKTVNGANITDVNFTATALSAVVTKFASLDNTQETTGSNSTGKGGGFLTVDTATGKIAGFLVHNVADANRAHIHLGARGVQGGILVDLTPVNLPSATMYTVPDNTFFPNPPADVASFLAGNLYFNVHNDAFPAGVIRGQLDMTPTAVKFASLDNTQETTGSNSTGKGGGLLAVDEATGRLGGFLVHNVADANRAHIHLGARGVQGGILVDLTPVNLPSATMYTVPDNTFFPAPPADVASFLAGNLYFNVHNDAFPAGVIRGQLDVPGIFGPWDY